MNANIWRLFFIRYMQKLFLEEKWSVRLSLTLSMTLFMRNISLMELPRFLTFWQLSFQALQCHWEMNMFISLRILSFHCIRSRLAQCFMNSFWDALCCFWAKIEHSLFHFLMASWNIGHLLTLLKRPCFSLHFKKY